MIRWLLVFLVLLRPALAETARIYSGEHADFTRLVIELPKAEGWTVGRTPRGYAFAVAGKDQPVFDLSTVWQRIPKTRLQALQSDPETGALQLSLACACHVFPFEYEPGVIVLDVKPGPAPAGSAFEAEFALMAGAFPKDPEVLAPQAYDWRADPEAGLPQLATVLPSLPTGGVSLNPLREQLLEEISRGAAEGLVDLTLPPEATAPDLAADGTLPWSQIHIGPPEAAKLAPASDPEAMTTPDGQACIADEALDIETWGDGQEPLDLIAEARRGIYGEFDLIDPVATQRAVRLHLYLGFGAEAAQYARLIPPTAAPEDLGLLQSMSILVDGNPDPASPFLEMLGCDGKAALWAVLAYDTLPTGEEVNAEAVARGFLALPPHLRISLGPRLSDRLLSHGDSEAARIVRNALERLPDVPDAAVPLIDSTAELAGGDAGAALEHATEAVSQDGADVREWMTLAEAHFQTLEPMRPEDAELLKSYEREVEPAEEAEYFRALALAELLAGETERGFRTAEEHGVDRTDVWKVIASVAEDDAFLRQAAASGPEGMEPAVATEVAGRLVELGFAETALMWLEPTDPGDPPERRRIAAAAELALGHASRSLDLLSGLDGPEDAALRAEAFVRLGDFAAARAAYAEAGKDVDALRLAAWQGAWSELASAGQPLWANASAEPTDGLPSEGGPLARGAALLEASAASRASIDALLAEIGKPDP